MLTANCADRFFGFRDRRFKNPYTGRWAYRMNPLFFNSGGIMKINCLNCSESIPIQPHQYGSIAGCPSCQVKIRLPHSPAPDTVREQTHPRQSSSTEIQFIENTEWKSSESHSDADESIIYLDQPKKEQWLVDWIANLLIAIVVAGVIYFGLATVLTL